MNNQCYLCGSNEFIKRDGSVRDKSELEILECSNCGLVTLSSFDHIQADHYEDSGMHGESAPSIEQWLKETEQDDARRFELLKTSVVNKNVLDFGCGNAGFLLKVQDLAASAAGLEPERRVHEFWKDKINLYSDLSDITEKQFDVITAFHVFEHLPDPRSIMSTLSSHLSKNGKMVIEVPSSTDALLTLYECDAFQRFTYWSQHLFLFSADNLRVLAKQAKMKIISIQQYQRYPLSNHLYWLSKGKPGGHQKWSALDTDALDEAYAASLAAIGKCDTLIAYLERE